MKNLSLDLKLLETEEDLERSQKGDIILISARSSATCEDTIRDNYLGLAGYCGSKKSKKISENLILRFIGIDKIEGDFLISVPAYKDAIDIKKGMIYVSDTRPFLLITKQNKKYSEEYKLLEKILGRKR